MKEGDSSLSEERIIKLLSSFFKVPREWIGIGDDTALLKYGNENFLFTCDVLNEGVHFKRSYFPPYYLGWKLIAINVSDIISKGGKPSACLLFFNLPFSDRKWLNALMRGISSASRKFGVKVVGGNTSASKTISLGCAMLGICGKSGFIPRKGAKEGEKVYLLGSPGLSHAGMRLLEKYGYNSAIKIWRKAVMAHLKPEPPVHIIERLIDHFSPSSMTDTSDSLIESLYNILPPELDIHINEVPHNKKISLDEAMYGGEDYNLLFTSSKEPDGFPVNQIGMLVRGTGKVKFLKNGLKKEIKKRGFFSHF
jgi:thiamine-monophosphate kinase